MTMKKTDLRDELRARYGSTPTREQRTSPGDDGYYEEQGRERAFVTHAESGRTVITAPVREIARTNEGFTYLQGRFVEADNANSNGALWTTEDLQMGGSTVAGGPLNWLHDDRKIVGALLQGEMVRETASRRIGNHIVADAAVWRFLFPEEARTIEKASADGALYYSMECISREVGCLDTPGRPGCGEKFSYADYDAGKTCGHLRERSSVRRFINPIFLGGAVIVPPVLPGWSQAEASVVRQAAQLTEEAQLDLGKVQAQALATAVLEWANR